jgi:ribosomal protein L10
MTTQTERISPARVEKAKDVAVLKGTFQKATSMVVLGYKGMDVPAVTELRARFRKVGVEYLVIKNTLFLQAIKGSAIDGNKTFEKAGIIQCQVGKKSFAPDKLEGNVRALMGALMKAKPSSAKGVYLRSITLSTTMGCGIKIDPADVEVAAEA